ncbi:unnamed protein product, partial [Larinioides sclopetarius]
ITYFITEEVQGFCVNSFINSDELAFYKFTYSMKYLSLILILCSELLYQNASGEKLNSLKHLFKGKSFNLNNEVYDLENDVFNNLLENNAGCSCTNGKCVNEDGKDVCKCPPGYGNYTSSFCKACDCGPNKSCIWIETGWWTSEKTCFCNIGYFEDNGKCIYACISGPCKNGGICKVEKNSFKCYCPVPFSGNNCETDICSKHPCENGGTCRLKDNSPKCDCRTPYFGDKCEKDPCTDNPCRNGGTCSLFRDSFKCNCKEQFSGDMCEHDPCKKNPCENGGTCRLKGNSTKCICKTPYFGDKCQKDPCTNNPCKNGGTCSLLNDSFKCDCKENFIGNKCEFDLKISTIMMSTETSTLKTTTIPPTVYDMCKDGLCIHGKYEAIGQYYRCRFNLEKYFTDVMKDLLDFDANKNFKTYQINKLFGRLFKLQSCFLF